MASGAPSTSFWRLLIAAAWISAGEMAAMAVVVNFMIDDVQKSHYRDGQAAADANLPTAEYIMSTYTLLL